MRFVRHRQKATKGGQFTTSGDLKLLNKKRSRFGHWNLSEIGFSVKRTMKCRLGQRLKKSGNSLPQYVQEKYGRSKELRYIRGLFVLPISYVQTRAPKHRPRNWCVYTPEGRTQVHKSLEKVNLSILHYLMEHPVPSESIEYNANRLALYCAQQGKCAVTGAPLKIGDIHCHHKTRRACIFLRSGIKHAVF